MKISSWVKYATGVTVAAAMLAACSSGGSSSFGPSGVSSNGHSTGVTTLAKLRDASLTMPHYVQPNVHTDHGQSFIRPDKKGKGGLLYIGDDSTNDVYVYDYPSGTAAGTLTGFDGPYGECSDTKGNVYIANFDAGDVVEYAHGGTSILKPTIRAARRSAVRSIPRVTSPPPASTQAKSRFSLVATRATARPTPVPAPICGRPAMTRATTSSRLARPHLEAVAITRWHPAVRASKSLSFSGTIDFPAGSSLGRQVHWPRRPGSRRNLLGRHLESDAQRHDPYGDRKRSRVHRHLLQLVCRRRQPDLHERQDRHQRRHAGRHKKKKKPANTMIGANLWCPDGGSSEVGYWAYPAGGNPTGKLSGVSAEPYGQAVSF